MCGVRLWEAVGRYNLCATLLALTLLLRHCSVIEVLECMTDQGMLPDVQICNSASRALSFVAESAMTADGVTIPPVTPKDITEAAESRNFRILRKRVTEQQMDDPISDYHLEKDSGESSFKKMKKLTLSTDVLNSATRRRSSAAHWASAGTLQEKQPDDFCAVTTLGGAVGAATSVGTNLSTVASRRFDTQVTMADRTLDMLYSELVIDLMNPDGTACPNLKCRKQLQIFEIINNFSSDANTYTVKCPYCTKEFVPRFTVCSLNADWIGSAGVGTPLWCELLSPWVLQKEILNIIDSNGIETIVSSQFRDVSLSTQNSVIFWNMMVYFRLYGMPYAFLITEKLSTAFLIPLDNV